MSLVSIALALLSWAAASSLPDRTAAAAAAAGSSAHSTKRQPNILLMLADDLGYGDLSVPPFTGGKVHTPALEAMAKNGAIMTNFHAAAPICSPSRASIMTGLFSWRVGIAGVYEYGKKDGRSNRNDWMNQMPTAPMVFREAGYRTAHVGKWHLGGMRGTDVNERHRNITCSHPGPNQMGFEEYVSMTEGPEDPRQQYLQHNSRLHTEGWKYMLKNDQPYSCVADTLSNCEAKEAIRVMGESKARGQPFFLQVWFETPHGPWEVMPKYRSKYEALGDLGARVGMYRTMVSAMDESIGVILQGLKDLDLEEDTLVLFTSDNGPEDDAGTTAGFRSNKRFLHEGGIRVPMFWQWKGRVEGGRVIDRFGHGTDILPTLLDAAGVRKPDHMAMDGVSLLSTIVGSGRGSRDAKTAVPAIEKPVAHHRYLLEAGRELMESSHSNFSRHVGGGGSRSKLQRDRVAFWLVDYEHPHNAAAASHGFKVILGPDHTPIEIYDLLSDRKEEKNLIKTLDPAIWTKEASTNHSHDSRKLLVDVSLMGREEGLKKFLRNVVPPLADFSKHGHMANFLHLEKHFGAQHWHNQKNVELVPVVRGSSVGKCSVPYASQVQALPFAEANARYKCSSSPLNYYGGLRSI